VFEEVVAEDAVVKDAITNLLDVLLLGDDNGFWSLSFKNIGLLTSKDGELCFIEDSVEIVRFLTMTTGKSGSPPPR